MTAIGHVTFRLEPGFTVFFFFDSTEFYRVFRVLPSFEAFGHVFHWLYRVPEFAQEHQMGSVI